ncbi:MAG: LysM peptidoglycan-binding domain-containing protein [Chloroflexota bacterium]
MNRFVRAIIPFLSVFAASMVVLSALSTGIFEGTLALPPTATSRPTLPMPNLTPIGAVVSTPTSTLPIETALPPTQTSCPLPSGWEIVEIQTGDRLSDLAARRGIALQVVLSANCLTSEMIVSGSQIYLPPQPTVSISPTNTFVSPTSRPPSCKTPPGWVRYRVQHGDTLTRLSGLYRVSVWRLRQANCLYGDLIVAGSRIWVPNVATSTFTSVPDRPAPEQPTVTVTPSPSPTPLPTPSGTFTFTPTSIPTGTSTPSLEPTQTLTPLPPTLTDTAEPTLTQTLATP